MVENCKTLSMRGVADLVENLISRRHVTMRMCRRHLTAKKQAGLHVQNLVITSVVFIEPTPTHCVTLKNLNAVNFRLLRGRHCEHFSS
jgi:hypothetical protein